MEKKKRWFLHSAWDLEDGYRMFFSNKPEGSNLLDITVRNQQIADEIAGEVLNKQWTTEELITYLSRVAS